jgi:uncharacterized LabA/DUF88 family protein
MRKFVAVYIDLENVAGMVNLDKMLQDIILEEDTETAEDYIFAVKIACGNASSIAKLRDQLINHNFEIREAPHISGKKNRADLIISLDAFEKLYLDKPVIDRFVFVTKDSDFSVIMDLLRKYGKEVWLITQSADAQRPIFTSCTDNIMLLSQPRGTAPVAAVKGGRGGTERPPHKEKEDEDARPQDKTAEQLFKRVLLSLGHGEDHLLTVVSNKMRQLDKSFKIKNTSYKKMTSLAKEFERKGWLKTVKGADGQLGVTEVDIPR